MTDSVDILATYTPDLTRQRVEEIQLMTEPLTAAERAY